MAADWIHVALDLPITISCQSIALETIKEPFHVSHSRFLDMMLNAYSQNRLSVGYVIEASVLSNLAQAVSKTYHTVRVLWHFF